MAIHRETFVPVDITGDVKKLAGMFQEHEEFSLLLIRTAEFLEEGLLPGRLDLLLAFSPGDHGGVNDGQQCHRKPYPRKEFRPPPAGTGKDAGPIGEGPQRHRHDDGAQDLQQAERHKKHLGQHKNQEESNQHHNIVIHNPAPPKIRLPHLNPCSLGKHPQDFSLFLKPIIVIPTKMPACR